MNIVINSNNEVSRIFEAAENESIQTLCNHPDVIEFFQAADGDEVKNSLTAISGVAVSPAMRSIIGKMELEDNTVLDFDLEAVPDEDEDMQESTEEVSEPQNVPGIAVVSISDWRTVKVDITVGKTTVNDVIFTDTVRSASGFNDTQLSNCTIDVNDVRITSEVAALKTLANGDIIRLSPKPADTKGTNEAI